MKAAATAALILLLPALAAAERTTTNINIAATVLAHITLSAVDEPADLSVSERDLARGYVDARARYRVQTNDRDGFRLRFVPRVGLASEAAIEGLGSTVVVRDLEVDVMQAASTRYLDLSIRFKLEPDLPAGRYPWPLQLSADVN